MIFSFFSQVNEKAGNLIQYDKFYIHQLDDLVDIKNDYVTWIQRQMYPMVSLLRRVDQDYNESTVSDMFGPRVFRFGTAS